MHFACMSTKTISVRLEAYERLKRARRYPGESFIAPFHVLPCTHEVRWHHGRVYRHLRRLGLLIGANDLWIAATALAFDLPLVTGNEQHYHRVPDLRVICLRSY